MCDKKYYEAYDLRYRTVHAMGETWTNDVHTELISDVISKYGVSKASSILEIGCGEGRDARRLLEKGYKLLAVDISEEAVDFCKRNDPMHINAYRVLDCIRGKLNEQFDFIYAVAVIHMLALDEDRQGFFRFIREHLNNNGIALIMTMGDGEKEFSSDVSKAFEPTEREYKGRIINVAGTSCRIVGFETFEKELSENGLNIIEKGITTIEKEFDKIMYAVVKR